jgi:HEPN domain-containing protein
LFPSGGDTNWKEGERAEESINYTFAKVLARANPVDNAAGEFDFKAKYKIDFGSKAEFQVVSVLDIYSYYEDGMGNPVPDDVGDEVLELVPEKRNISRALGLAKKLTSLFQRRKVLRRLFLHWFRHKDPDIAAEMTKFIEAEVIRLKILCLEESRLFTSYWSSYARREKTTFSSYSHWTTFGHYDASEFVKPNKGEASRWIEQSKADLKVATEMLRDKSYAQVCFMSQQCVEKVLKGALYAKCGIPRRELHTHEIRPLASSIRRLDGAPSEVDHSSKVANYYLATRYPDRQPFPKVPAKEYSDQQAKEALEVAKAVYTALEKFVNAGDN